jgi:hypothetical protein
VYSRALRSSYLGACRKYRAVVEYGAAVGKSADGDSWFVYLAGCHCACLGLSDSQKFRRSPGLHEMPAYGLGGAKAPIEEAWEHTVKLDDRVVAVLRMICVGKDTRGKNPRHITGIVLHDTSQELYSTTHHRNCTRGRCAPRTLGKSMDRALRSRLCLEAPLR